MEVSQIPRIIYDGDIEAASHLAREGMQQLNILKSLMSFNKLQQDVRRVEYIDGSRIVCRSCFGEDIVYLYAAKKEEGKLLPKLYVYVTISNYVTIWDLLTGEVAEDICNNNGKVHDQNGDPLITFPCHKSELVKWLEGIPNKSTRQILKDEPEDNRDYRLDNQEDIGNENRVICLPDTVPWYDKDCFGLDSCYAFLNTVKHESGNTCATPCPACQWYDILEKDGPKNDPTTSFDESLCINSWHQSFTGFELVCYSHYYECSPGASKCYLEIYKPKSQHLILCPYPHISESVGFCHNWKNSLYEVIDMVGKQTSYTYHYAFMNADGNNSYSPHITSNVYSYKTPLEELLLDFIPRRKLEENIKIEDYKTFQETMRTIREKVSEYTDPIPIYISENNLDDESAKYIQNAFPSVAEEYWPLEDKCIVSSKSLGESGESDRYAISWCAYPFDEGTEGKWYKVKLFFYTGKVLCTERNGEFTVAPWGGYQCINGTTVETSYDRFSSVQATIELEYPKTYKKENTSVSDKPDWVRRYRRPEDYSGLCSFPDRDCGYPEDEENNTCYPYDGTYDIYTLGEAIEKLINDHYEDGSDDQLSVYFYERPNMIEEEV